MIQRLRIERFGLFQQREFALGPVTVFLGSNEAGKTTVFDALVEGLCAPSEATSYGKRVKQRYGDRSQRSATVEPAPGASPDAVEFLSVHAIRSGEADLRMAGKNWLERLRASLFTGGLNPANLAEELKADARKASKTAGDIEKKRDAALGDVAEWGKEREDVLRQRGDLSLDDESLGGLRSREDALRDEIDEKEKAVALQRRHAYRRRLVGALDDIGRLRLEKEKLGELAEVERDWSGRIGEVRGTETAAQRKYSEAEGKQKTLEEQAATAEVEAERAEPVGRGAEERRGKYAELRAMLEHVPDPLSVTRVEWSVLLLALGVALLAGSAASGLAIGGTFGMTAMVVGLAVAVVTLVSARRQVLGTDTTARDRFLAARRSEIEALRGRSVPLASAEALTGELATAMAECAAREGAASEARADAVRARATAAEATAAVQVAKAAVKSAEEEVARLFKEIGATDEADLSGKKDKCSSLRPSITEREQRLKKMQDEFHIPTMEGLETLLSARLEEGPLVPGENELAPAALQRLEEELVSHRSALDALLGELREDERKHEGRKGELRGTLGKLPEQIAEAEVRAAKLEAELRVQNLEARACGLAAVVFEDIASDTQGTVRRVAEEAARRLETVVGAARSVEIGEVEDPTTFRATDAGGGLRPIDDLSSGTRDALLFSVRLALAEQLAGPVHILLLDEPFGALDPGRVRGLLLLLDDFQKRLGFQLVFLTKEPTLRDAVRGVFPGAILHNLDGQP